QLLSGGRLAANDTTHTQTGHGHPRVPSQGDAGAWPCPARGGREEGDAEPPRSKIGECATKSAARRVGESCTITRPGANARTWKAANQEQWPPPKLVCGFAGGGAI